MKKIIFATGNEGKMKEIRDILSDLDVKVLSMKEAWVSTWILWRMELLLRKMLKSKAKTICELCGEITLADDSGLEIDYLTRSRGFIRPLYGRGYFLSHQKRQPD